LARLIEILHYAEEIKTWLHDEELMGDDLVRKGIPGLKESELLKRRVVH